MKYIFHAYGHPNIQGKHKSTLEFTKDKEVSLKGDCIIGVRADFEVGKIKKLLSYAKLKMTLVAGRQKEELVFRPNKDFKSNEEIVVRLGNFSSERTFGTEASKSSMMLSRKLMEKMKKQGQKMKVTLEPLIKVLIFDLDDTIEDFQRPKQKAHERLAKEFWKRHNIYPPTTMELLETIDRDWVVAGAGKTPDYFDRRKWLEDFFERVGEKATKKEIERYVKMYWEAVNKDVKLLPGARKVLERLGRKYQLVLMSDADGPKKVKMERIRLMDLDKIFDYIILGNDIKLNKPNKRFYERIFKKLGVEGEECVMVGDKPWADLKPAAELGIKTVWMKHGHWGNSEERYDYVDHEIKDVRQMEEVIEKL